MSDETKHTPGPWLITYAHDRRAHRHRCQTCHRIVNTGERVWMARVSNKATRVIHADECADVKSPEGSTALELMTAHAVMYRDPSLTGHQAAEKARTIVTNAGLLDACSVALGHMTGGMDGDWRDCDPVELLRTTIAKAEGHL